MKNRLLLTILLATALSSCGNLPESVKPIEGFQLNKYLGKWYEIARLDHRFERGLEKVTAHYSLNEDGSVKVENSGFSTEDQKWQTAVGKARLYNEPDVGYLEVSFFGPFYGPYVIFQLDKTEYQYAFVASSENALWLLSRTPQVSEQLKNQFIEAASAAGFATDELIWVNQQ